MDQQYRSGGWKISGVVIIICGFIIFPLAIGLIFSWPSKIGWFGIMLIPFDIWMIYAGFKTINSANKEIKDAEQKQSVISTIVDLQKTATPVHQQTPTAGNQILAHWKYPAKEWMIFLGVEKKDRKFSFWIEFILISFFGAFAISLSRDASWVIGFVISVPLGFAMSFLRFKLNLSSISLQKMKDAEVIITNEAVIVNGHYHRLFGDNLWLGKVEIKKLKDIDILEITYCWGTRSGTVSEELNIPIPAGKNPEAYQVMNALIKLIK